MRPAGTPTRLPHLDDTDLDTPVEGATEGLVRRPGTALDDPDAFGVGVLPEGNGGTVARQFVPLANGDPDDPAYLFTPDGSGLFVEVDW